MTQRDIQTRDALLGGLDDFDTTEPQPSKLTLTVGGQEIELADRRDPGERRRLARAAADFAMIEAAAKAEK